MVKGRIRNWKYFAVDLFECAMKRKQQSILTWNPPEVTFESYFDKLHQKTN